MTHEQVASDHSQNSQTSSVQVSQTAQSQKPKEMQPYHISILDTVSLGAHWFHSSESTELILGQIRKVIQEEGPISRSLLAKRILQAWGIARLGARLDQRFTELLMKIQPKQYGSRRSDIR